MCIFPIPLITHVCSPSSRGFLIPLSHSCDSSLLSLYLADRFPSKVLEADAFLHRPRIATHWSFSSSSSSSVIWKEGAILVLLFTMCRKGWRVIATTNSVGGTNGHYYACTQCGVIYYYSGAMPYFPAINPGGFSKVQLRPPFDTCCP